MNINPFTEKTVESLQANFQSMNIVEDKKSMYVTAEGFGKHSVPTNHSQQAKPEKENAKLSPKNITV
jgi:hypothetical protein